MYQPTADSEPGRKAWCGVDNQAQAFALVSDEDTGICPLPEDVEWPGP